MEEQVTDMFEVIRGLQAEVTLMRKTIDKQHVQICELTRSNQRLTRENHKLKKRLAKYGEPNKDSSNNSTPPSKEGMKEEIIRRTSALRKKSERKPGGQFGHEGSTLDWKSVRVRLSIG